MTKTDTHTMSSIARLLLLNILLVLFNVPCEGQEMPVPADLQYSLLNRILAFDRNLGQHQKSEIVIGILFQGGFRLSSTAKDKLVSAIRLAPLNPVNGLSMRCVAINLDDERSIGEMISANNIDVLYVSPLRAVAIETITTVTQNKKILTLTGVAEYADEGIAITIGIRDGKPQIIINITSAKAEGADLNPQILRVAKVIQ